jgi:hypothetical protein
MTYQAAWVIFIWMCHRKLSYVKGGRRGRDRMEVGLPMQTVPTTTDVVSCEGEVYNIMW